MDRSHKLCYEVACTEESELFMSCIFAFGIWPKQKCHRSELTIQDSTKELEGKPIELENISLFV